MGYSLDMIISRDDFEIISFKERTFYWENHEFSLSPREFTIDDNIIFIEITYGTMYNILTKETMIQNPVVLTLHRKYNSVEQIINKDSIYNLFKRIDKLKKFEIYLWEDDESINSKYRASDRLNIMEILKDAIHRRNNILIYR